MDKCKTKATQTDLGMLRHNQGKPGIIQAYSEPYVTLAYLNLWDIRNPDIFRTRSIFRTLACSQPWYIQKFGLFKTLAYSKFEAYSKPCQTSTIQRFVKIVTGYHYFHKLQLFSMYKHRISSTRSLLHKIDTNFFSTCLIFTPEVVIPYKKLWRLKRPGTVSFLYTC